MNKRWRILYGLGVFFTLMAAAFLIYMMNRITNDHAFFSSMMEPMTGQIIRQAAFIFMLSVYGFALLMPSGKQLVWGHHIVLALIVGTLTWAMVSQVVICLGIPFTALSVILGCVLVLAVVWIVSKPDWKSVSMKSYILPLIAYASLAVFFAALCVFRFSYDSFIYINTGEKLAKVGYLTKDLISIVSGFSIFTSMFFAPAEFFGFDFSQGLYLFFNTAFAVTVSYFTVYALQSKLKMKWAVLSGFGAFLLMMGANMFFEIMYWPLSNLPTAAALFLMIYFIHDSMQKNRADFGFFMSLFFGISFIWLRSEHSLFMLVAIFLISNLGYSRKRMMQYTLTCLLAVLLWYFRFFAVAGISFDKGAFLTIDRALPVLAAYVAMIVYLLWIRDSKLVRNNAKWMEPLFFGVFILGIAGMSLLNPEHARINFQATFVNIYRYGGWGGSLILFSGLLVMYYGVIREYNFWDKMLLSVILFYCLIFVMRDMPLRIGYGDSGNRYFTHMIPLVAYMVGTRLIPKLMMKKETFTSGPNK